MIAKDVIVLLLGLPLGLVGIFSILGLGGRLWWVFDLMSHFRPQYFLLLLAGALAFLVARLPGPAAASALFAALNLLLMLPLYSRPVANRSEVVTYRLLLANVLQPNQNYGRVLELARSVRPDFIVLIETNETWLAELETLLVDYPYILSQPREDNYGLTIYSRFPLQETEIRSFSDAGVPSLVARINLDGNPLTIVATHPPPPKGGLQSALRNQQLAALARFVSQQPGALLLCGDFNMSPWSPHFQRLLHDGGLQDSTRGFGIQPTWPVKNPLFRTPIDHCLGSSGVVFHSRTVGPDVGSDHFPVILDFSL